MVHRGRFMVRASDTLPITAFTRNYKRLIEQMRRDGAAHVLTIDGRGAAVVQSVEAYDAMVAALDTLYVHSELARGLAATGPSLTTGEARARLKAAAKRGAAKAKRGGRA